MNDLLCPPKLVCELGGITAYHLDQLVDDGFIRRIGEYPDYAYPFFEIQVIQWAKVLQAEVGYTHDFAYNHARYLLNNDMALMIDGVQVR